MNHIEYKSIANHYNSKTIDYFREVEPDLGNWNYTISEKIDGANIQLLFQKGLPLQVGRRGDWITIPETFYDIWNVLLDYEKEVQLFQDFVDENDVTALRIFGELYGPGVQGRINYGPKKKISFFDAYVIDTRCGCEILLTQDDFDDFMTQVGLDHMKVPRLAYVKSLQEALDFNVEIESVIAPGQPMEGVVIIPTHENLFLPVSGDRFIIKKKSDQFAEVKAAMGTKVKEKPDATETDLLISSYINKNRVLSCFSKLGEIKENKQIGQYVKAITEDVQKDFAVDHPDLKARVNGKEIVALLMEYL